MAGKIINMSKVKQVLRLHTQGVSNRRIALDLGLYKGTVNSYIRKIKDHGYDIAELLKLDDPVLESKLFAGNPAYKDRRFEEFKGKIPYFEKELERPHVTRYLLWEEYRQDNPEGYGYSQFCFHLGQILSARKPGSILEHSSGEKLFVDFAGDTFPYVDRETGEVKQAQVFAACLPYSNYTFAMAVPSQRSDDFLYALTCCLHHLGGSPPNIGHRQPERIGDQGGPVRTRPEQAHGRPGQPLWLRSNTYPQPQTPR